MSVADKIRAALVLRGKTNSDAAEALGITTQAFNNKLNRNSFFLADVVKIAAMLEFDIAFTDKVGQKIIFTISDLESSETNK